MIEIGVGKVIKGWDEGKHIASRFPSAFLTRLSGVVKMSLGEKAVLIATPDYVCIVSVISSSCLVTLCSRHMAPAGSHLLYLQTLLSSSSSNC